MNISKFFNINALGIKLSLAIKKVKVNLDSSVVCKPGTVHIPNATYKSQGHWPFGSREEDI